MADNLASKGQGGRLPSRYSDQFQAFRTEMDRLFDSFLTGMPVLTGLRQTAPALEGLMPMIDVKETDADVVVQADLPGLDEKDVTLTVQDGILTFRGEKRSERKDERENYHMMERSYGSFHRAIRLPDSVDADKAQARFVKGVLTVTLPKRPELAKAQKKIEIKSS
jgi:HSP20 family protein